MIKPKVGLITFGDHREDMWEKVFKTHTQKYHKKIIEVLKSLDIELYHLDDAGRTREQIDAQVDYLKSQSVDLLVAHTPCWTSPNLVVHGVQGMDEFTIMVGNKDMATHGCVGTLGAAGALSQIGLNHKRFRMDYSFEDYKSVLMPVFTAAMVKKRLKGSVFGLFGGRSIGIDTATYDPMGWKKQFGIDSEHIDQSEIVRRAKLIEQGRIDKLRDWIEGFAKEVVYNEVLTKEKFDYQIACYLATKDICEEEGLQYAAIKCMPDLSTYEVPQCMTATFMPDNFDGEEGVKEGIPIACEADADNALTQQILKLVSKGKPTFFSDVSHIDDENKIIYCVNCGGMCSYYADRNAVPEKNLAQMTIKQSIRPGGAAISCFHAKEGDMQLARLYRVDGQYKMAIIPSRAVKPSQEMIDAFVEARGIHQLPVLFANVTCDIQEFVDNYGSNHIAGVEGRYVDELMEVCRFLGVEPIVFE